ncbi:MAG: hypothetical protein IPJ19_20180 [Planctomycetes bacterium]|nr:hypothetical protein [Planctomycetota bacterium]
MLPRPPESKERSVEALAAGWQQLAREMRFLALRGSNVDPAKVELLQGLVRRSAEAVRVISGGSEDAPALGLRAPTPERGIALRMVQSGCPAADERVPPIGLSLPPSRTHRLLLTGSQELLAAQDVVSLLAARRLVGSLELKTARESFTIELDSGEVAHMHTDTPVRGERLGDILVQRGILTPTQIENIRVRNQRGRIGEALLLGNWVTEAQLLTALETQIHLLIGRLCRAESHQFAFWQGPLILARPRVRIGVGDLLLAPAAEERAAG